MQDFVNGLTVLGIPLIVLVPFVVQGLKTVLGMPARWAGLASVVLSAILLALAEALRQWPDLTPVAIIIVGTFVIGLGAPGVFDLAKGVAQSIQARAPPQ